MKNIEVSFMRRPMVVVRFRGVPSDAEFREYLGILEGNLRECIANGTFTALVIDTSVQANAVSASQRRVQADWIKEHHSALERACVGTCFVASNALQRGVITAVMWLQQLPYPYSVVASLSEAESWCLSQLAEARERSA